MMLSIDVNGTPTPQGSKVAFRQGERVVLLEGKPKARRELAEWREAIAEAAKVAVADTPGARDLWDCATSVSIGFRLYRGKSVKRHNHTVAPDIDKLARAVLDGLTGAAFKNDARVVELWASKRYVEPGEPTGASITVEAVL